MSKFSSIVIANILKVYYSLFNAILHKFLWSNNMTYNEAIKLYNGSRRKMAESLGISVQGVAFYGKNPDGELPPHRVFMINALHGDVGKPKSGYREVVEDSNEVV
jgi:hypothetical protein